jgi:hypothetical protein
MSVGIVWWQDPAPAARTAVAISSVSKLLIVTQDSRVRELYLSLPLARGSGSQFAMFGMVANGLQHYIRFFQPSPLRRKVFQIPISRFANRFSQKNFQQIQQSLSS